MNYQTILVFNRNICLILSLLFLSNSAFASATIKNEFVIPVASFSSDKTTTYLNQTVAFTDLSTNTPTSWTWSFSPATVTYQNGTTSTSQNPEVRFDATGTYTVNLTATNADGAHSTSKSIYIVGTTTAPLTEGFAIAVPPTDWAVINPDAVQGWNAIYITGSGGVTTRVARMDNYQYNAVGQLDELVVPAIDISNATNPKLYFDVAYAQYNNANSERLHIEYSTDAGVNFNPTTYDKASTVLATTSDQTSGWAPTTAGEWRAETVDLTAYKSTHTILKIIQTAGYGNGLFIDNVRIGTDDFPVANFSSDRTTTYLNQTVALTDLSTELPTSWSWSFSPATVTYQNGTTSTSRNPQVSFDATGTYSITLTVSNQNGNHSITKDIYIVGTTTAPLTESFTTAVPPTDWVVINPDASKGWEAISIAGSDGIGTQVARMDNYQYNVPGQLDELVVPAIDLSTVTNPKLYFDVAYAQYDNSSFERLHIEYSTDAGVNFNTTTYDKASTVLATTNDQTNGWAPTTAGEWRAETVDLTAYKSTHTILKFIQTAGHGNGLFIDNVRIGTEDAPVADFSSDRTTTYLNQTVALNDSSTELPTSWSWSFSPATVTYQNNTTSTSRHPQVSFDATGTYSVTLTVSNANGNHSITKAIYIVGTATAPLTEDFTTAVPPTDWAVINPDASKSWEAVSITGSNGMLTQVARIDNFSYPSKGQLDELVIPAIDISSMSQPTLYFDVAYVQYDNLNFERLHIEYSTDAGTNFNTTTYDKASTTLATASDQTTGWAPANAGEWRTETVDLTAYKSTHTILKLIQTAGFGNGLFIDNVKILDAAPLPVELISFTGEALEEGNLLTWQTASETNNNGFEIEQSINTQDWETIGFVNGNGTTTEVYDYEFIDNQSLNDVNYYRLKQIDFDGKYEYSSIISISRSIATMPAVSQFYLNPSSNGIAKINIATDDAQLILTDNLGRIIKTYQPTNGTWELNTTDLPSGIYYANIVINNISTIRKLIIQ